jgi:hypothetical protein
MPGNVDYVHRWLVRTGNQQGFASEGVHGQAGFISGYVEAGYADAAVFGDAEDAQVEEGVVEGTEGQRVGYLVGALLAVPADVGGFDADGVSGRGRRRSRTWRTGRRRRGGLLRRSRGGVDEGGRRPGPLLRFRLGRGRGRLGLRRRRLARRGLG